MESLEQRRLLVGELIELQIDAFQDGQSILTDNRVADLQVGEQFELSVSYSDLRSFGTDIGAFFFLADISVSQHESIIPLMGETQALLIDVDFRTTDFTGGVYRQGDVESEFSFAEYAASPLSTFAQALSDFGYEDSDYELLTRERNGDVFITEVQFDNLKFPNEDIPEITIEFFETDPSDTIAVSTESIPAVLADGSLNPDALATAINFVTPSFDNEAFYEALPGDAEFRLSNESTLHGVGGIASQIPRFGGGIPELHPDEIMPDPFFAFTVDVQASAAGNGIEFSVASTADNEEAVLLFGRDAPVPVELVLLAADAVFTANISDSNNSDPTVSGPIVATFSEADDSATINLLTNAIDRDGDNLSVANVILSSGDGQGISVDGNTITVDPTVYRNDLAQDSSEVVVYSYEVVDGRGGSISQTATVTITGLSNAPVGQPDSFSVDPINTLSIEVTELLENDSLGEGEDRPLSVAAVSQESQQGGTVELAEGVVTYTPPASFLGEDSFTYTLSDGQLTTQVDVNVEVLYLDVVTLEINLPEDQENSATIFRDGDNLIVSNQSTVDGQQQDVVVASRPLAYVSALIVHGSDTMADTILVDHSASGGAIVDDPDGDSQQKLPIDVTGGSNVGDSFELIASTGDEAIVEAQRILLNDDLINYSGFESHSIDNIATLDALRPNLSAGESFTISQTTSNPVVISDSLELAGGSIVYNSVIVLGNGVTLSGNGSIDASFIGSHDSIIRADGGDLTLGGANSENGFVTSGEIQTGSHTITLQDADQAALGALTTLGSDEGAGTLVSLGGFAVEGADSVVGHGTLQSTNSESTVFSNRGLIQGNGVESTIEITGLLKGFGRLDNVTISGISSPDFDVIVSSPHGNVSYAEGSTLRIELGGTLAGPEYDQVLHDGVATIDGLIDIDLIDDFVPAAGQSFDIIQATESLTAQLENISLPELTDGLDWIITQSDTGITIEVGIDIGETGNEIEVSVVDGELVVRDGEGNLISVGAESIRITVDPASVFESLDDWSLAETEFVDGQLIQRVTDGEFELEVQGADWTNFIARTDIDGSGQTTARDAIVAINQLGRQDFVTSQSNELIDPALVPEFPGLFFDVSGDGMLSAIDPLQVINQLARELRDAGQGEGEVSAILTFSDPVVQSNIETTIESLAAVDKIASFESPAVDSAVVALVATADEDSDDDEIINELALLQT